MDLLVTGDICFTTGILRLLVQLKIRLVKNHRYENLVCLMPGRPAMSDYLI